MKATRRQFLMTSTAAALAASAPVRTISAAVPMADAPLKRPENIVVTFEKGRGLFEDNFGQTVSWLMKESDKFFSSLERSQRGNARDKYIPENFVRSFARQTAFLEYVSLFPDQVIADLQQAALDNRMDSPPPPIDYGYEHYYGEYTPWDYRQSLAEKSDYMDMLKSLKSRKDVRAYIDASRQQFKDLLKRYPVDPKIKYEPVKANDIRVLFGQPYYNNSYFTLNQNSYKPFGALDWSDDQSLNYRIEKEFLEMHGVHLGRYELAPDVQRFMDANKNSILQRYKESQNKDWLANEACMEPGANPRKPFTADEKALFQKNADAFEACIDELKSRKDRNHGALEYRVEVLGDKLFSQTLAEIKKTAELPQTIARQFAKGAKRAIQFNAIKGSAEARLVRRALLTLWQATMKGHGIQGGETAPVVVQPFLAPKAVPALEYKPGGEIPAVKKAEKVFTPISPSV